MWLPCKLDSIKKKQTKQPSKQKKEAQTKFKKINPVPTWKSISGTVLLLMLFNFQKVYLNL